MRLASAVLRGALWAVAFAFPLAALSAAVYRFPIPFSGYESGPAAALMALIAVLFYGVLGGFVALLAAGALGGVVAHKIGEPDARQVRRLTLAISGLIAFLAVGTLAILDKLIGPW